MARRAAEVTAEATIKGNEAISIETIQAGNRVTQQPKVKQDRNTPRTRVSVGQHKPPTSLQPSSSSGLIALASSNATAVTQASIETLTSDNQYNLKVSVATTEQTEEEVVADAQLQELDSAKTSRQTSSSRALPIWNPSTPSSCLHSRLPSPQRYAPRYPCSYNPNSVRGVYTPGEWAMMRSSDTRKPTPSRYGRFALLARPRGAGKASVTSPILERERLRISLTTAKAVGKQISGLALGAAAPGKYRKGSRRPGQSRSGFFGPQQHCSKPRRIMSDAKPG